MKLIHFEIPAGDAERAKGFWGGLFGWQFTTWRGPFEYHVTEAGGGPGGAVLP
jgi:predicted enzyme related to lactoylglutathione lyase